MRIRPSVTSGRRGGRKPARWSARFALLLLPALATVDPRPAAAAFQDSTPVRLPRDWEVATPSSQGIDPAGLERLSQRIGAGEAGLVHGFLVVRGGRLVFERYYRGGEIHQIHTVQSVTKSVSSALIGIAMAEGLIKGVDQPLSDFFPEHKQLFDQDPRKQRLTLRHVLTMTLGNDWKEGAVPYSNPANIVWRMAHSDDWMGFVLGQPMAEEPGGRFNYNSGSSLLLSGILQKATGMQAHVYAEKRLFDPLGIPVYGWYRNFVNPNHWSHTGGGLNIRARDLAKLGYLYVSGGTWNGKQIVPASWVEESGRPRVRVDGPLWYGYQWWLLPMPGGAADSASVGAIVHGRGWGGQYVFAIRSLDLVVVFTSGTFEDQRRSRLPIALLQNEILPLVRPGIAPAPAH